MNKFIVLASVFSTGLLVSCTQSTVYPMGDNSYKVVSLARSESAASQASMDKATKTCSTSGKSLKVIKANTQYQGMDKNAEAMLGIASQVVMVHGQPLEDNTDHSEDYRNTLFFTCE